MNLSFAKNVVAVCTLAASLCLELGAQVPRNKSNLTRAGREAWHQVLKWPDEYEESWRNTRVGDSSNEGGVTFYSLGRGKYLVEINIYPGAYQPGYIFMLYEESRSSSKPARLLNFKHYGREVNGRVITYFDSEMLGFFTFDKRRKTIEVFSKSRGPGDCGSVVKYKFVGSQSVPVEARAQPCYDDPRRQTGDTRRWQKVRRL